MTAAPAPLDSKKQLLLAGLVAATASIPLNVNLNSIGLIIFIIVVFIQQPWSIVRQRLSTPSLWMIPAALFFWFCLSWLWDSTGGFRFRDVERYAPLLLPGVIAVAAPIPKRFIRITCAVFICTVIAICCCCLVKSWQDFHQSNDSRYFFYHYLSGQMDLNAIFLSNYCLASVTWLFYDLFLHQRGGGRIIVTAAAILFLLIMILLLSSKLIILLTVVLLLSLSLYFGFRHRHFVATSIVVALIIAAGWLAAHKLGYMRWRFTETSAKKYSGQQDNNNGLSIRLLMWHTAWDLVRQRPILGYGVRGGREEVIEKYKEENFLLGFQEGYHSHNEYLQVMLAGGIPALLLFIAMLFQLARQGFHRTNILLLLLLFHFLIQSIIESTFEVQQELVFYIFFLFLFYYHQPDRQGLLPADSNS